MGKGPYLTKNSPQLSSKPLNRSILLSYAMNESDRGVKVMSQEPQSKPARKRSLTDITIGWIADRLRRAERIKEQVQSGQYQVNTDKVAASIINEES